jgi:tetratricopeptide (TPR) repeat protein
VVVPKYFDITPGTSTKAEVDLNLGEPLRKLEDQVYEYAAPRDVSDTSKVTVSFFPDTKQVARLDVYLKSPLPADTLRQQFGNRVIVRDRTGGEVEEIFYPKIHALILRSRSSQESLSAVSYLSPRYLADLYVERFNSLQREKRFDDAQTEADKAVLVDPDYARGYVAQGTWYQSQKNYEEAIVRFSAAANSKYSSRARATAHARLGSLYSRDRILSEKAEPEFKRAISLAPDLDEAHYLYGQFLVARERKDDALAHMVAAVELNPENMPARIALADNYYQREGFDKALPHYEVLSRWVESQDPEERDNRFKAEVHFRNGYCAARKGDARAAIDAYTRAIQKNPGFTNAYNNRGRQHLTLGDYATAIDDFRAGLKIDVKHKLLNQNLGTALLESGRLDEARRQLELSLGLDQSNAGVLLELARCWGAFGKKKQTLHYLQQAIAAGYKDRTRLTSDRYLALVQKDGDFKKMLAQVQ